MRRFWLILVREIIDESDVYIDVQKGLRRTNAAPKSRVPKGEVITDPDDTLPNGQENLIDLDDEPKDPRHAMRRHATHTGRVNSNQGEPGRVQNLRRTSSTAKSIDQVSTQRGSKPELRDQWKNLGPSNPASRPKQTRYNTVKIKPGGGTLTDYVAKPASDHSRNQSFAAQGGVGAGLLNSAGKDAKDGVLAVQAGYGSINSGSPPSPKKSRKGSLVPPHTSEDGTIHEESRPRSSKHRSRATSQSTLGSMNSLDRKHSPLPKRGTARSGSITEQIVDTGGIKKTVLEMTSSSDDPDEGGAQISQNGDGASDEPPSNASKENRRPGAESTGRKKRRRKRKTGRTDGEDTPLLGDER